ncbi:preprotein translocase subunit YajC [Frondihabitans peucedani]|uniref:Preprotein translocase subunit YajC n=1 Tax=Frondihabitans peucedani TaxID=598626 RepID=A0ABP8DYI1_9MICO
MDPITGIMLVVLVVLVFFIFRNRRRTQRQQAELQTKMVPGVELMLTFGIYGTLVSIDDENNVAEVEIAPGTVITVHRQTLGRIVEPVVADDDAAATKAAAAGSTSSYSLNEDHAITTDPAEYGERVDGTTTSPRENDTDK